MIDEAAIGKAMSRYNKWLSEQNPEKLRARIAALEAALKPFDEMLQRDFSIMADDKRYADDFTANVLTRLGDLRAARAAMEK